MARLKNSGGDVREAGDGPLGSERWSIVLAAGSGRRLASVTGGIPKQAERLERWRERSAPTPSEERRPRRLRVL